MILLLSVVFTAVIGVVASTSAAAVGAGAQSPRILHYSISEELPVNSFVADLAADYARATEGGSPLSPSTKIGLRSPSPYFRLDQNASNVLRTSRQLDRETICPHRPPVCELTVDVSFRAVQLLTVVKVVVAVEDVNDHAPEFPISRVQIVIPADAAVGALFPLPAADDADSGRLGAVEYRLLDGGSSDGGTTYPRGGSGAKQLFDLKVTELVDGSHDVRLQLIGRLDQRPLPSSSYQLTVLAVDGGSPPRSSSLAVSATVERSTPVIMPRFDQSVYTARVAENQPRRHPVVQVRAQLYSPDVATMRQAVSSSAQIAYSLEPVERSVSPSSSPLPFGIEPQTGLVYVRDNIDYEKERIYRMTIVATYVGGGGTGGRSGGGSRGVNSAAASLVVDVVDSNDNAPELTVNALTRSGRAEFPESAADGTFVAHLAVADADGAGDNSRTTCTVINTDLFRLDQLVSGSRPEYKLVTACDNRFDRETIDSYHVTVACRDYGTPSLTSTVVIPVDVGDDNDNDPQFADDFYVVRIGVPISSNDTVVELTASDRDTGPNADLRYRIDPVDSANGAGLLIIDPQTGAVSINASAPKDAFQPETVYRYIATVSDSGNPPRSSTASVLIRTIRGGDVERETGGVSGSVSDPYHFAVGCDRPIGSQIGRLGHASSAADSKSRLRFVLARPNTWFRIDPKTGDVILSTILNDELTIPEEVKMSVQIVDDTSSSAVVDSLLVSVEFNCEQLPRFLFPHPSNDTVKVNVSSLGGRNAVVIARPVVQSRPGSHLRFSIVAGNVDGTFAIDAATGAVSLMPGASSGRWRSHYVLSLSVTGTNDDGASEIESLADMRVVIVGGTRTEKEIAREIAERSRYEDVVDDEEGEGEGEEDGNSRALKGALFSEWNVIVIGMACGAVLLILIILIAVVLVVRRKKRPVKHSNNYNCRLVQRTQCIRYC
jgi:hypothetical protein